MARTNYCQFLNHCVQWPWHLLRSSVTIVWNIITIHSFNKILIANYVYSDFDLWLITLGQCHDTFLGPGQQSCEILFKFIKRVKNHGPDKLFACLNHCVLWLWPLTSDLGSRSWHFLGSSLTILWNIPIHAFSENLWPRKCLNHSEHSDLDLWRITLNQGHAASLGKIYEG
jgi:hypothetical protein